MSKIFLDIGARRGESTDFFLRNHPNAKDFHVFMFEPERTNIEKIKKSNLLSDKVKLIEKAAWDKDGASDFFIGNTSMNGSMFETVKTYSNVKVETIDISNFIKTTFDSEDEIILKINANGSEHKILSSMNSHGLLGWINRFYIKWYDYILQKPENMEKEDISKLVLNSIIWEPYEGGFDSFFKLTV